jgi:DNA-binding FadR family transcriptional regulator
MNTPQLIANDLRGRIMTGDLEDGTVLPPLEELMGKLGAGKASVRQGLQILESEGLISVRRGRLGGSVVHRPRTLSAGESMAAVFQSGDVAAVDLSEALAEIEPICAGFCARRPDRAHAVLPHLRHVQELGRTALDHTPDDWPQLARMFHEELVARCGNATMVLLIGAVESVCSTRAAEWVQAGTDEPDFPTNDEEFRRRGLDDHALILTFIERGDVEAAAREARRHLHWVPAYTS